MATEFQFTERQQRVIEDFVKLRTQQRHRRAVLRYLSRALNRGRPMPSMEDATAHLLRLYPDLTAVEAARVVRRARTEVRLRPKYQFLKLRTGKRK